MQESSPLLINNEIFIQNIIIEDDLQLTIAGRVFCRFRYLIYVLSSIITAGFTLLLCRWNTAWKVMFYSKPCPLANANYVLVSNQWGESSFIPIKHQIFNQRLNLVFPKTCRSSSIVKSLNTFEYRYFKFTLNPVTSQFEPNYSWIDPNWSSVQNILNSDVTSTVSARKLIFGENQIKVKEKSNLKLLVDEILHPFFVFQIASIILWSLDDYYYYAICIFTISIVSVVGTFLETKKNIKRMQRLAAFSCDIPVWRNECWENVVSDDLVPGDVIELLPGELHTLPCDCILLAGNCILNESILTGESLPVSKKPVPDSELAKLDFENEEPASSAHMSKYFMFAGTKLIRVRGTIKTNTKIHTESTAGALALVVRTGFNTTKGSLIRSMLFPRPNTFKFYQDSFRFIGVLATISAIGFLYSLYYFLKFKISYKVIIIRALDLITIAVPPALPATMAIGTSFAISRLRKRLIFCTSPPRVNIGGKLNLMCFDKTGTLTEEGLDVLGIRFTVSESESTEVSKIDQTRFSKLYKEVSSLLPQAVVIDIPQEVELKGLTPAFKMISGVSILESKAPGNPNNEPDFPYPLIVCAMACCHSLKVVGDNLIGDPLELKMFNFTKWDIDENISAALFSVRPPWIPSYNLVESKNVLTNELQTEFNIKIQFEFTSKLRRMSVITSRVRYATDHIPRNDERNQDYEIFVKGAPEALLSICKPQTIPPDFSEKLEYYTHHGYRVIAVGYRELKLGDGLLTKINRNEIESNLDFLGFIVFENKLKSGTSKVIRTLNHACIRQVMCTGDNILTSISVSRECGLIYPEQRIFYPTFISGMSHEEDAVLVWQDVSNANAFLDGVTFKPRDIGQPFDYVLAITGDAFQWMIDFATDEAINRMLVKCQIFARMSPDQKQIVVERLQLLGYCVGFCGDGTNDCGALKAADVGLSLSEEEASVAAPFTSHKKDLECVLRVIQEGRAALVTSFSCFKYMALYSMIQFTSVSLLYSLIENIGDFQFLFIDLCLIIPLAVFMGRTGPHPNIARKRPTASLVSKKVLASISAQIFVSVLFQVIVFVWVRQTTWYEPGDSDIDNDRYLSYENTVIFIISSFQYIAVALVFNVGPPYRAGLLENAPLVAAFSVLTAFTTYLTLFPPEIFASLFNIRILPIDGRILIMALAIINFGVSWLADRILIPNLVNFLFKLSKNILERYDPEDQRRKTKIRRWEKKGQYFKCILEEFR